MKDVPDDEDYEVDTSRGLLLNDDPHDIQTQPRHMNIPES